MGLFRVLNPLALHPTAPRHRTARAAERLARLAEADAEVVTLSPRPSDERLAELQAKIARNQARRSQR